MLCQVHIKRPAMDYVDDLGRMNTSQSYSLERSKQSVSRIGLLAIPPLCLSLPMVGHSFPSNFQTFIPDIKSYPRRTIKFPPCSIGDSMF